MSDASPAERGSRFPLWLIIALCAAPVVASYLLYYFAPPARTANYGELIEPRPLPDAPLTLAGGDPFRLSQLKGKWVLVTVDGSRCEAACEKKLVYLHQLRLTQGRNQERIERLWLVSDDGPPRGAQALA